MTSIVLSPTLRELQRRYIDVSLHDSTNSADVCLVDFREAGSSNSLWRHNGPLGSCVYQRIRFGVPDII
jgi:hypothetical protein